MHASTRTTDEDEIPMLSRRILIALGLIGIAFGGSYSVAVGDLDPALVLLLSGVLAAAFGSAFDTTPAFSLATLLIVALTTGAILGTPDVRQQLDDGAFWLFLGVAILSLMVWLGWLVGATARAVWRAATRPRR